MNGLCEVCMRDNSLRKTSDGMWVCDDCWQDLGYDEEEEI